MSVFYSVENVRDLSSPTSITATVCSKNLKPTYSWIDGSKGYEYKYYLCNKDNKIITTVSYPYESNVTSKVSVDSNVELTYYAGSKEVKSIQFNGGTAQREHDKWYFIFIIFIGFIFIPFINKTNIQVIEEKVLSEEEEYILYLLGKKTKDDKPKNFIEKIKEKFKKKDNNDIEEDKTKGEA